MTRKALETILLSAGIAEAKEEAMRLFCHFTGRSRASLYASPETDCSSPALLSAVERRTKREPLAYVLGEADFFEETYAVGQGVLIPRPESELLVEKAVALLPANGRFADFCTGSGCLAVSLCRHRPDVTGDAFDISPAALTFARQNAARYLPEGQLTLIEGDLLSPALSFPRAPYDLILSNPPYVRDGEKADLPPEVLCEPPLALFGGEDGLRFYRYFLLHDAPLLKEGGAFLFEIGAEEGEGVASLARECGFSCTLFRDYASRDRIALLKKN